MIRYAKIINEQTGLCVVGIGTNAEFYQSIGMTELDVQQSDIDNSWYLTEKCPMKTDEEKEKEERVSRLWLLATNCSSLSSKSRHKSWSHVLGFSSIAWRISEMCLRLAIVALRIRSAVNKL